MGVSSNNSRGFTRRLTIRPNNIFRMNYFGFFLIFLDPRAADASILAELPGWETGFELGYHSELPILREWSSHERCCGLPSHLFLRVNDP